MYRVSERQNISYASTFVVPLTHLGDADVSKLVVRKCYALAGKRLGYIYVTSEFLEDSNHNKIPLATIGMKGMETHKIDGEKFRGRRTKTGPRGPAMKLFLESPDGSPFTAPSNCYIVYDLELHYEEKAAFQPVTKKMVQNSQLKAILK